MADKNFHHKNNMVRSLELSVVVWLRYIALRLL